MRDLLISLIYLPLASCSLLAQAKVTVRDGPSAPKLRIQLIRATTLREPAGAKSWVLPASVVRDARGWFYVLDQMGPNHVQVFDSKGRRVRNFSRDQLQGRVRDIAIGAPDTLHVVSTGGHVVFDAAGHVVRRKALSEDMTIWNVQPLSDGRVLVRALIHTPKLFGYPLHVIGVGGTVDKSFGAGKSDGSDGSVPKINGSLALTGRDRLWTGMMSRYELSQWTTAGELVRVVDRQVAWFPTWDTWDARMDVAPPVPRLMALQQDRKGNLIALCHVAASDWKAIPGRRADLEGSPATVREIDDANDSVLEVIDPVRASVVASGRFRQSLIRIIDDSLVAGISTDSGGEVTVDIWKFRLIPQRGGSK